MTHQCHSAAMVAVESRVRVRFGQQRRGTTVREHLRIRPFVGPGFAEGIMASGRSRHIDRSNTRPHQPARLHGFDLDRVTDTRTAYVFKRDGSGATPLVAGRRVENRPLEAAMKVGTHCASPSTWWLR